MAKQLAPKGLRINARAHLDSAADGRRFPGSDHKSGIGQPSAEARQTVELSGIYVLLTSNEDSYATGHIYRPAGGSGGS